MTTIVAVLGVVGLLATGGALTFWVQCRLERFEHERRTREYLQRHPR